MPVSLLPANALLYLNHKELVARANTLQCGIDEQTFQ